MTTIEEAIRLGVKSLLNVTHTCLPGVILTYDYKTQKATVQPSLRKVYQTGENPLVQDMPVLNAVPVIFPRSGSTSLSFPIAKGDRVLVLVSERSLDQWINSTEEQVTPQDPRQFHLADAVCIPGLYPFSDALPLENNEDFVISHGESRITIKKDGEIDIKTSSKLALGTAAVELLQQISDTLAGISSITVTVPPGSNPPVPFPIDNIATFTTIKGKIDSIKGTIT